MGRKLNGLLVRDKYDAAYSCKLSRHLASRPNVVDCAFRSHPPGIGRYVTSLNNLEDEYRTELLCYVMVGQLVAQARTGGWLRGDHSADLLSIWANGNAAQVDWLDRLQLRALSEKVALVFAGLPGFADSDSLAHLFTDGWRMDYRSPIVRRIYTACENELKR